MHAINSTVMKEYNRRLVLDYIRRRPTSRAELAELTELTRASITQIVDELMALGVIAESSMVGRNRLGRRLTQLALLPNACYMVGISISRQHYDLSIINLGGEVLYQGAGAIQNRDVAEVLDEICGSLARMLAELDIAPEQIFGAGVCAPGPLDTRRGVVLNPPNFALWHNLPLAEMLESRTGLKVYLENIANAHVLDEKYFGIGRRGVESFMLMRVDDGVGAGLILKNRLFTDARGQSPEIGHVSVDIHGPVCACGNRGCLEEYISVPALIRNTRYHSWAQVVEAAGSEDEAGRIVNRAADYLAFVIVSVINVFDLQKIVLSGEFARHGEILAAAVNRRVNGKSLRKPDENPVVGGGRIEIGRIAAMPAYHRFFSEI